MCSDCKNAFERFVVVLDSYFRTHHLIPCRHRNIAAAVITTLLKGRESANFNFNATNGKKKLFSIFRLSGVDMTAVLGMVDFDIENVHQVTVSLDLSAQSNKTGHDSHSNWQNFVVFAAVDLQVRLQRMNCDLFLKLF
jgi:hypothetical protein